VVGHRLGLPDGGRHREKALRHDGTRGRHPGLADKEDAPPEVPPKQTFKFDGHPALVTG
jgi:hypothetical protein